MIIDSTVLMKMEYIFMSLLNRMDWFEALKIYGDEGHGWHIPKKGSEGYKMIKTIQKSEKPAPEPVQSAKHPKRVIKKDFSEKREKLLEHILSLKQNAVKFAKEGTPIEQLAEYYNHYIMPELEEYEKVYGGVRNASLIVDNIQEAIRSAYHSEEAVKAREPKKEEIPVKEEKVHHPKIEKKAKKDYSREELQEIVHSYYKSKGQKFGGLFSKGKLLTLIKMNKIPMP